MNKNELLKSVKVVILGLILSLSMSYAYAAPTSVPPLGNVAGPLNIGPSTQTKQGSFVISNGGFRSAGPALLNDIVVIGLAPSNIQNQSVSFNSQDQKSKGLFAKLSGFLGFTDDSLKTKTALAAPLHCGSPYFCDASCGPGYASVGDYDCSYGFTCCGPAPINATCGSATGGTYTTTPPTSDLCASGTPYPTPVVGSAPDTNYWKWDCVGINGGTNTSTPFSYACKANKTPVVNGSCGSAVGQTYPSAPSTGLCSAGTATVVTASGGGNTGYWQWGCNGSGGGTSTSATACTANKTAIVNGACGSVSGTTVSSLTSGSANLCSAGVVASFAGNGPWTWGCNGSGGGTSTSAIACNASKILPPPPAKILTVYGSSELNGALTVTGNISSNNKLVCLQDGTNCPTQTSAPSTGTSLWNITTSPNIETALSGSVKITGGVLNIGTGNYVLNTGTSILKTLKLDGNGSLTSPDLFGVNTLTFGNNSTGNSALQLDSAAIRLATDEVAINSSSYSNGNLIFKANGTEAGRIIKFASSTGGIGLRAAGGATAASVQVSGSGATGVVFLSGGQITLNDDDVKFTRTNTLSNIEAKRLCVTDTASGSILVLCDPSHYTIMN